MKAALETCIKELFDVEIDVSVDRPDPKFGDFASNIALQLAKQLGKNPREIAESIAEKLRENADFSEVTIAGPGFINVRLHDNALLALLKEQPLKTLEGKTVLVEYSDPNPFKPLHAGHLYTTLVGDMVSNLFEHAGAKVVRINYSGDVGRHVGISMWSIITYLGGEHPEKLADISESEQSTWLGARYVEGNQAFEDDETVKSEILATNKRVYQLHDENDHDSPFAQIYWTCRQWSYDYFATMYEQLHVHPFERYLPESEVAPVGLATVKEQLANGVYKESDGAVIFDGETHDLHARVFINSEGLPTYEAKEVGLSITKWRDYHPDLSFIITGNDIVEYMKVVIKSIEQFLPDLAHVTKHLPHGNVKLAGGVKMSSRKGNVLLAMDIIESAHQAAREKGRTTSEETVLAAIKYGLAKNRMGGDIIYDPKESISLEGNSGPYLQYAHARAKSILAKSHVEPSSLAGVELDQNERLLVSKLTQANETIAKATVEMMPHYICTYLYELAQEFNRFYEKSRIIGDEREALRLSLVHFYADTLKNGLSLLGIVAPDTM